MPRTCLFCDNPVNSKEHVWPEWVLAKLPKQTIMGFVGSSKGIVFHREWKVKCACRSCNSGWMSDLETDGSSVLGPLIDGRSTHLSALQQRLIAAWAIKTAMVVDSV